MNSKTEDFPAPVTPTRRMVYGIFALVFDVLMIPFLRDSTSLENIVITGTSEMSLWTYLIVGVLSSSSELATISRPARIFPLGLAGLLIDTGERVEL